MKPSHLVAILRRLETMREGSEEVELRRFEKDGVEQCVVQFYKESGNFELRDSQAQQTYQFDDIDLVAIEIFELLQA